MLYDVWVCKVFAQISISDNLKKFPLLGRLYKTDFILIPFAPLVLRFSWDMFSIHLPHRNQRYECAYGIQRVLICYFPKPQRGERCIVRIDPTNSKPQRGERCIKPTNVFHAINANCRIRVWYSALVSKTNLSGGTQGTNYPGSPTYPENPGSDKGCISSQFI